MEIPSKGILPEKIIARDTYRQEKGLVLPRAAKKPARKSIFYLARSEKIYKVSDG
jgi:hypothetical protein